MAQRPTSQNRAKPNSFSTGKPSKNAYKVGKLTKKSRFTRRKINRKLIFVLAALLLSFIFAVILGNHLSQKAEQSGGETPSNSAQNPVIPSVDKVLPDLELNAFYVDLSTSAPESSLSDQTGASREKGNALFIEINDKEGKLTYSSTVSSEISCPHNENLALSRLKNHLEYYNDYAIGGFSSSFSPNLDTANRTKTQANELLILSEAAENGFSQIFVDFSQNITKNDLIYYQTYLLNLKLSCKNTPIGVKIPLSFVSNAGNHGILAELMKVADFFVLDFSGKNAEQIKEILEPLVYFSFRYEAVAILSADENTLQERISALSEKGIDNYIVK
ncbi:MAG: hypothetical protein IKA84_04990 [Clostridia bacterium]|nr:hypothetical protein [Clostridia bacterium]